MEKEMEMEMAQVCNREYKVLIVDYDVDSLTMLEEMLQTCRYNVTKCQNPKEAISTLQEDDKRFDIIITELDMPENNGFEILKNIGLKMDLLVIMMISCDDEDLIRKGIICGACDYLLKPIRVENVRHLWKHVYTKQRRHGLLIKGAEKSDEGCCSDIGYNNIKEPRDNNAIISITEGEDHNRGNGMKKMKHDAANKQKKPRTVWTNELHQKFVAAYHGLGDKRAAPKRILERMDEPNLTRASVASHLQKYRQYLKRNETYLQHQSHSSVSLEDSDEESPESISAISNHNLQAQPFHSQIEVPKTVETGSHQPLLTHNTLAYTNVDHIVPYGRSSLPMTINCYPSHTNMNYRTPQHFEETVPKQILKKKNEPDLTREIIASHLQKQNELYSQHQSNSSVTLEYSHEESSGIISTTSNHNLQAQAFPSPTSNLHSQIEVSNLGEMQSHQPQFIHYTPVNANGAPIHPYGLPRAINHNASYANMNYRHSPHSEGGQQYGDIFQTRGANVAYNRFGLFNTDGTVHSMPN